MADPKPTNLFLDILEEEDPDAAHEWRLKNPDRVPFGLEEQALRQHTADVSRPLDASMPAIAQVPSSVPVTEIPEGLDFATLEHFSRQIIRTKQKPPALKRQDEDEPLLSALGGAIKEGALIGYGTSISAGMSSLSAIVDTLARQHEGVSFDAAPTPLVVEGFGGFDTFGTGDIARQATRLQESDAPRERLRRLASQIDQINAEWQRAIIPQGGMRIPDIESIGSAKDAAVYLAERLAQMAGSVTGSATLAGATRSIFAGSSLMGIGQMRDAFEREGITDSARRDAYVYTGGLMIGMFEAISLDALSRGYISRDLAEHVASTIPRRVLLVAGKGAITEGFTEFAQDATELAWVARFKGQDVAKAWWDQRQRLRESFLAGAIGGAGAGVVSQVGRDAIPLTARATGTQQTLPDAPAKAPDLMPEPEQVRAGNIEQAPEISVTADRVPVQEERPEEPRPVFDQDEIAVLVTATDGLSDEERIALRNAALGPNRADLERVARLYGETGDMARAVTELRRAILGPQPTPEAREAEAELRRFEDFADVEPLTPEERETAINEIMAGEDPRDAYETAGGEVQAPDPRQNEQFEPLEAVLEPAATPEPQTQEAAPEPVEAELPSTRDVVREIAWLETAIEADRQTIAELREQIAEVRGERERIAELRAQIEEASRRIVDYNKQLKRLQEEPVQQPPPPPAPEPGADPAQPATVQVAEPTEVATTTIKPKRRVWGGERSKTPATGLRLVDYIIRAGGIRPWRTNEGVTTNLFGGQVRPAEGIREAARKRFGPDALRRPGVFTSRGYTLDDAALWDQLVEGGYIPPYHDENGVLIYDPAERIEELLLDDLNGREVFSTEYDRNAQPVDPEQEAAYIISEAIRVHEENGIPYDLTEAEEDRLIELARQTGDIDTALERLRIEEYNAEQVATTASAPAEDAGRDRPAVAGRSQTGEAGAARSGDAGAGQTRQPAGGGAETHIDPYAFSVAQLLRSHGFRIRGGDPDEIREAQIAAKKAAAQELRLYSFESLKAMAEAQKIYGGKPKTKEQLIDVMLRRAAQRIAKARPGEVVFQLNPETAVGYRNFYSRLRYEFFRAKMNVAPGNQWQNFLRSLMQKGVKKEEVQWSGIEAFLETRKSERISRDEILRYLEAHQFELTERVLSERLEPIKTALAQAVQFRWGNFASAERLTDYRTLRKLVDQVGLEEATKALARLRTNYETDQSLIYEAHQAVERSFPDIEQALDDARHVRSYERYKVSQPPGENYNELLIRMPMLRERWQSPHYHDHEIVHVRFDDLQAEGKRLLRIQEVQSDLHQQARDRGYAEALTPEEMARLDQLRDELMPRVNANYTALQNAVIRAYNRAIAQNPESVQTLIEAARRAEGQLRPGEHSYVDEAIQADIFEDGRSIFGDEYYGFERAVRDAAVELFPDLRDPYRRLQEVELEATQLQAEYNRLAARRYGIPDAPFKEKAWLEFALKRMLLYAVENGYDGITWSRADQIGSVVGAPTITRVSWNTGDEGIEVRYTDSYGETETQNFRFKTFGQKGAFAQIRRVFGDVVADAVEQANTGTLKDLSEPNIGMRLQYDHEIGEFFARYTKQWGGKVERTQPVEFFDAKAFWDDVHAVVLETANNTDSAAVGDALRQLLTDMQAYLPSFDPDNAVDVLTELLKALPDEAYAALFPHLEVINARWEHDRDTGQLLRPQTHANEFLLITEAMRQAVPKGQPLFQLGGRFASRSPAHKRRIRDAINEAIQPMLHMLPPAVRINVIERLEDLDPDTALELLEVGFNPQLMSGAALPGQRRLIMSVSSRDPKVTFGHEVIHMLRGMGLIHDREWRVLTRYAERLGILDQKLPGSTQTLRERYEEQFAHMPKAERERLLQEEAVAWMLQQRVVDGQSFAVPINNLLDRLIEFLIRLKNALLGRGYRSDVDVIVGRIRSGEVAQRAREIQVPELSPSTLFAQSVLQAGEPYRPARANRIWQIGKYRIEREDEDGTRTYYIYDRGGDEPIGYTVIVEREGIGWEVEWTETAPGRRREGVNTAMYKAIERDTGQPRRPSGTLLPDGYNMWLVRDAKAVLYHREWNGIWYSPKQILINLQHYENLLRTTRNPAYKATYQKTVANLRAIWNSIPEEGKTPEKLAAMFQIDPLVRPPGGLQDTRDRPAGGRPGRDTPQQSLRQIIDQLAKDLGLTIRQGRLSEAQRRAATRHDAELLAQFDETTGVIRTQVYDDLNRISHEAGHAIVTRLGDPLKDLINNAVELPRLDPLHNDPNEGFAEFMRRYITNPSAAQRTAPQFYAGFETFMAASAPETLQAIKAAQQAYTEWLMSSSYGAIGLSVVSMADRTGFEIAQDLYAHAKSHTLPELLEQGVQQIDWMAKRAYFATFDEAHPIRRAVDWLTEVARINGVIPEGVNVRMLAADDPYNLFRMMKGAWEAGRSAIVNGVAPYSRLSGQFPAPQGPSLYSALTKAFGRNTWSREEERQFGSYLKSRMMVMRFIQWRPELMQELQAHVAANPQHQYLLANAAVYAQLGATNPLPYQPDEFTFGDHLQNLLDLEAVNPRFVDAAQDYYGFIRNLVKKAFEAGLPGMTPENYAELIARPDYAPMWRDMSEPGDVVEPPRAAGTHAGAMTQGNRRAVIKGHFQGSNRPVINPLESAMQMAYQIEAAISYNETVAALANLASAAGPGGGVIAERLNPTQITASQVEVQEVIQRAAKELGVDPLDTAFLLAQVNDILGENAMATLYRRSEIRPGTGEAILWYGENGKLVPLLIGNAPLAREVFDVIHQFGVRSPQWDMVLNMLGATSFAQRSLIVLEPWFQIRNFLRDQISYFIQAPGYIPVWTGLRGLRHVLMGSEFFKAYQAQGGMMGGPQTSAIEPTRMKRRVAALQRGGFKIDFSWAGLKDLFRGFEFLETASRLGYAEVAYRRAIRQGMSPYQAMRQAVWESREIMDFDKSGAWLAVVRRLIPFFNANLVGLDRSIRVLLGGDERDRGTIIRRILSPFASGGMRQSTVWQEVRHEDLPRYVSAWLRLAAVAAVYATIRVLHAGEDDEDESNDYENAVFAKVRIGGEWVFLPKPYDFAPIINLAEAVAMRLVRGNTRAMEGWVNGLWYTLIPPHDVPLLRTYYGIRANYDDFFGRPIVAPELLGLEAQLQFNSWTSEFSKKASEVLSPIADISPAVIDYVISNHLGTWGRYFLTVTNMMARGLGETDWRDFTGGVVRPIERSTMSGQRFWELMAKSGEYSAAANTLEELLTRVSDPRTISRYLDGLDPERRAYAILQMAGTSRQHQLHPLNRARSVHAVLGGIMRDMDFGRLRTTEKGRRQRKAPGEPIELDGREKLALKGLLQTIQYREQANALMVMREPGWTHRRFYNLEDDYALLKERFPEVAEEIERRLKAANVREFDEVARGWPYLRDLLLSEETRTQLLNGDFEAIEGRLPAAGGRRRSSLSSPIRARVSP